MVVGPFDANRKSLALGRGPFGTGGGLAMGTNLAAGAGVTDDLGLEGKTGELDCCSSGSRFNHKSSGSATTSSITASSSTGSPSHKQQQRQQQQRAPGRKPHQLGFDEAQGPCLRQNDLLFPLTLAFGFTAFHLPATCSVQRPTRLNPPV